MKAQINPGTPLLALKAESMTLIGELPEDALRVDLARLILVPAGPKRLPSSHTLPLGSPADAATFAVPTEP
ncbi:MAG: hypothetical protein NTY84_03395 [Verrucomicrobia bacterium]|nr:hypothetical protein [Verrucomicrobiota bacterium]